MNLKNNVPYDYFKDLDSLFNNLYNMDLLLNKEDKKNVKYEEHLENNLLLDYGKFTIYFYDNHMDLRINHLNKSIYDNLYFLNDSYNFSILFIPEGTEDIFDYFRIICYFISYKDIEQLKEFILKTYEYL